MSTAELNEMRKQTKRYIDAADERVLKMIHAMLEADSVQGLSPEQEAALAETMALDRTGRLEYSSWTEVRSRIETKGGGDL